MKFKEKKKIKALEDHGKHLAKSISEKESLTLFESEQYLKNLLIKD